MSRLGDDLDRRLTPARPDLAAAHLRGKVEAERFIDGIPYRVLVEVADLKRAPRPDAPLDTQLLFGQTLVVYDEDAEGWGWAQSERDGYVGYVAMRALGRPGPSPTHRVVVKRTFVYPAADMKQPVQATLPLDGRMTAEGTQGAFTRLASYGFVYSEHVAPIDQRAEDPVTVAEGLLGTPYLWGGASPLGIDCSGLVQLSWSMAGIKMPRDTDMQESFAGEALGATVALDEDLGGLERGDLVFWKGHVGIMSDETTILHANAHHMLVAREPLRTVSDRILVATGLPISSVRRVSKK